MKDSCFILKEQVSALFPRDEHCEPDNGFWSSTTLNPGKIYLLTFLWRLVKEPGKVEHENPVFGVLQRIETKNYDTRVFGD